MRLLTYGKQEKSYMDRTKTDPLVKIYLKEAGSISMLTENEALEAFKTIEQSMFSMKRVFAWFKNGVSEIFSLYDRVDGDESILEELSYFSEDGMRVKTLDNEEWRKCFVLKVDKLRKLIDEKTQIKEVELKNIKTGDFSNRRSELLAQSRAIHKKISSIMESVKLHPLQIMNISRKIIEEVEGLENNHENAQNKLGISLYTAKRLSIHLAKMEDDIKLVKQKVTKSNLRLVVNIAKKYMECEVPLMDLIQEGNMGLMRAVNRYDYRKGYHFSTYATWWIKQAVTRAIADQGKTVRIPVHMVEILKKYRKTHNKLIQERGYRPSTFELAERLGISEKRMAEVQSYTKRMVSLDMPILDGEKKIEDTLEDSLSKSPIDVVEENKLQENMDKLLKTTLDTREEKILRMRFGIGDYTEHTLSEIGKKLGVCRERVRQLEKRSLKKLGKPFHELCPSGL